MCENPILLEVSLILLKEDLYELLNQEGEKIPSKLNSFPSAGSEI